MISSKGNAKLSKGSVGKVSNSDQKKFCQLANINPKSVNPNVAMFQKSDASNSLLNKADAKIEVATEDVIASFNKINLLRACFHSASLIFSNTENFRPLGTSNSGISSIFRFDFFSISVIRGSSWFGCNKKNRP
ncbi:MAG: hypothetical protein ACD_56C00141G0019 [uncultured bacterium]|nr:MAG: hypothetical protein ACD_56C00141G0019 [uncultured bacterium]